MSGNEEKRQYKNITVVIRTIDNKTNNIEAELIKNIDGPERREWLKDALFKAAMWAMFNGKYIELSNKEDE